jgi:hypothetical protein
MAVLGFVPGYVVSLILSLGLLLVPEEAERIGLDKVKVPIKAYPEFLGSEPTPHTPAE